MAVLEKALFSIGRLDSLARQDTAIHRIDPRAKIITTAVFVVSIVSFGKYEISALLPYLVYPLAVAGAGKVPLGYVARRIAVVAPFAIMVGMFNPLLDKEVLMQAGPLAVTGGWVSFASILLRFALTIGTAVILVAVTSFEDICMALQRLGVPRVFTVQLMFLYRYMFVLAEEALRLVRARALRSFGRRGTGIKAYGSLAGSLLVRTLDRARRIHLAMLSRGFSGEIRTMSELSAGPAEAFFILGWCSLFVAFRLWDLPVLLGSVVMRFPG